MSDLWCNYKDHPRQDGTDSGSGVANRTGRKIFMGDTGSLTLGYILSFLAVQYTMNTYEAVSYTHLIIQLHFMFLKCLTYGVIIKNSFFLYSIVIYIK